MRWAIGLKLLGAQLSILQLFQMASVAGWLSFSRAKTALALQKANNWLCSLVKFEFKFVRGSLTSHFLIKKSASWKRKAIIELNSMSQRITALFRALTHMLVRCLDSPWFQVTLSHSNWGGFFSFVTQSLFWI